MFFWTFIHLENKCFSTSNDAENSTLITEINNISQCIYREIFTQQYVTLEHKTSHKGQFFDIEINKYIMPVNTTTHYLY